MKEGIKLLLFTPGRPFSGPFLDVFSISNLEIPCLPFPPILPLAPASLHITLPSGQVRIRFPLLCCKCMHIRVTEAIYKNMTWTSLLIKSTDYDIHIHVTYIHTYIHIIHHTSTCMDVCMYSIYGKCMLNEDLPMPYL
jgi:hypothetical protein